jgi:DNA mismatch repair protein MutS2
MNDQAFSILEYRDLLALVRRGAQTPMGRARVESLTPIDDLTALRRALVEVAERITLRHQGVSWSFADLADSGEALGRLQIAGAALEPLAILELARLCESAMSARAAIFAERDSAPTLWSIVAQLPRELPSLVARIRNKILPSGELDDRASPELARLRHEIARLRSQITRSLESLMRRSEEAIQDELVTVRNDRFVIPVRSDHRARVQGVAHGFSSSGATVFVEPLETIDANNELQTLRELEQQEAARILFALSEELRGQGTGIEMAARAVEQLDFIGAKAAFHERFDCVVPEIGNPEAADSFALSDARHPLLEENLRAAGGSVVPVSFTLDREHSTMVISGANAGGKTVVLKTAGLLALMALSGLPVPAREARVPFYASVLADIGDHQSLAANLSTFTSHIGNIARMIQACTAPALVLLDEVGTGTDPEEGSALGIAVVDHFRRVCAAHVIATTHYSGLKMYAANEEAVLNASVEFDEQTLQPTYRLLVGLAGSSSGLDIARRFGIPANVISNAAEQVQDSSRKATEYLRRIKRESENASALREALEEERAAVAEKFAALDKEAARKERERQAAFERALQQATAEFEKQAHQLLSQIEDRAERLRVERETQKRTAELKRTAKRAASGGSGNEGTSTEGRGVRVLRDGQVLPQLSEAITTTPDEDSREQYVVVGDESGRDHRGPGVGDRVRLKSFGSIGIVDAIKNDEAEVRVGSLRLREKLSNLELVEVVPPKPDNSRAARLRPNKSADFERTSDENARAELNVIGRTTEEAVDAVDKYLDEAFLNSLSEVRIVHGHGTGALRRAIAELLQGHPHVARFAAAPPNQGGAGATVVELRQ